MRQIKKIRQKTKGNINFLVCNLILAPQYKFFSDKSIFWIYYFLFQLCPFSNNFNLLVFINSIV